MCLPIIREVQRQRALRVKKFLALAGFLPAGTCIVGRRDKPYILHILVLLGAALHMPEDDFA